MLDETPPRIQDRSRDPMLLTWYRFVRVLKKITYRMDEAMQGLELSRSQFDLLMQVAFEKGISQQTCAERMNVTKGNITQHLDHLEKRGLVWRQKEGRTNKLHLTDEGQGLVGVIMPVHDQQVKEILSALSEEEFQQFQAVLRKLDRSLP